MRRTLPWLALYGLLSLLFFGRPVLSHLGSRLIAADPVDSSAFTWFFAWWPHALLHGLNPFVTHLQFAPDGYNLTWSTSMPVPSVLFAPITLTAGPVVTYNLIELLSPALSAWAMFLLCRHVTARTAPSLVGGFVYGFSPYVATHLTGGPYLALVPLPPLAVLLALRRLEGTLTTRRYVIWLAVLLVAQAGISTEVLATGTLFAALALLLALALLAERRAQLLDLVKASVIAYAAAGVVLSPFLYYFFFGPQDTPTLAAFSGDLLGPVVPPTLVLLTSSYGGLSHVIRGAIPEDYLGAPLLLLVGLFGWRHRRERTTWIMLAVVVVAYVATLGGHLWVRRDPTGFPLPWLAFYHLPLFHHVVVLRMILFALVPIAIIVARWLARDGGRARWVLAGVAVLAILPHFGDSAWRTDATDPAFFSSGQYRTYLKPADRVLTIPVLGPNQRWQANTKFGFTLATGYAGTTFPAGYTKYPIWLTLVSGRLVPNAAHELRRFIAAKDVSAIVVDPREHGPWTQLFGTLGVRPLDVGGVRLYRLPRAMFS